MHGNHCDHYYINPLMGGKTMKRIVASILALLILLAFPGCAQEEVPEVPTEPEPGESLVWETMPVLTYGVMEYEKLEVLPWYSGRAEATSSYQWAETAEGYYRLDTESLILSYADKTALQDWIPVCNRPDCAHNAYVLTCNAVMRYGTFFLREGKLYFVDQLGNYPELYTGKGQGHALFCRDANGSNTQLAYVVEDALLYDGGSSGMLLTKDGWFYNVAKMNTDGSYTATAYLVDENGMSVLLTENFEEDPSCGVVRYPSFAGDWVFTHRLIGGKDLLRYEDGEFVTVPIGDHLYDIGYLSGNVLRTFRENDGYYDIDLAKQEEVFLAESRLKNSRALFALPNCIIETNIGSRTKAAEDPFALEIFDGEVWHSVQLPQEILEAKGRPLFSLQVVASDRILFKCDLGEGPKMYQVMLADGAFVLELCVNTGEWD